MGEGFQRLYFDKVYNPIYDLTTATLGRYRSLQHRCVERLRLNQGDRVLCLGLGTGNEITAAAGAASRLRLSGVDLSPSAIRKAGAKARSSGISADLRVMDARSLSFESGSFDRVLCVHVLDFVDGAALVVAEALRVLAPGGRFVVTLPSAAEGPALGASLFADQVRSALRGGKGALRVTFEGFLMMLPVGLVYLPLLFRGGQRAFSREQASALFAAHPVTDLGIEEEVAYQDLIVWGRKA